MSCCPEILSWYEICLDDPICKLPIGKYYTGNENMGYTPTHPVIVTDIGGVMGSKIEGATYRLMKIKLEKPILKLKYQFVEQKDDNPQNKYWTTIDSNRYIEFIKLGRLASTNVS